MLSPSTRCVLEQSLKEIKQYYWLTSRGMSTVWLRLEASLAIFSAPQKMSLASPDVPGKKTQQ